MLIRDTIRHGLFMQRVTDRLRRMGLSINPYYLIREGVQVHDMVWPNVAAEFSSSLLTADDLSAVAAFRAWDTEESLQARIDRRHLCILLKHGERVAGFTWANLDEVNDVVCSYSLRPDEAYLYDAYVAPDFRGRSLAPYMRFECYKHLRRAGKHTFYSISDYFNRPAIRFKLKLHAEIIQLRLQIRVGAQEVGQWVLKNYRPGELAPENSLNGPFSESGGHF